MHPNLIRSQEQARGKRKHVELASDYVDDVDDDDDGTDHEPSPEAVIEPSKSTTNEQTAAPRGTKLWLSQLDAITEFRATAIAPVDSLGAAVIPQGSDKDFRFQCLLGVMLSAQTKDQITSNALKNLRLKVPGGLSVANVINTSEETIRNLIYPVGFYKRKAEYIKRTSAILQDKYEGDIPSTLRELQQLPGVGPKMAYICMNIAWNKCVGIAVDTHVHRISNRIGWVKSTKTPEQTRIALEEWVPREQWRTINTTLVGFGQVHCLPINPKCLSCPIRDTCNFGKKIVKDAQKKNKKSRDSAESTSSS